MTFVILSFSQTASFSDGAYRTISPAVAPRILYNASEASMQSLRFGAEVYVGSLRFVCGCLLHQVAGCVIRKSPHLWCNGAASSLRMDANWRITCRMRISAHIYIYREMYTRKTYSYVC